jgi:hypothetical protein
MIDFRNEAGPGHILTMEDPVEYVFTPKKCLINQREVGNDTHSFHDALRNAMRQAPDIILIGEIRDLETMRMALTYALSGHLCLATLHANNAYQAMNRVISFFPLEVRPMLLQDLSVSLKAVISQRLIKTGAGTRVPAMEVLLNTRNVSELIEKGEIGEIKDAMERSMSPGSQTFEQDLFRLVRTGKITADEGLANADSATNLGLLLGKLGHDAGRRRAREEGRLARRHARWRRIRRLQDHRGILRGPRIGDGLKSVEQNLTQYAAYHRDPPQHRDAFRRHPDDRVRGHPRVGDHRLPPGHRHAHRRRRAFHRARRLLPGAGPRAGHGHGDRPVPHVRGRQRGSRRACPPAPRWAPRSSSSSRAGRCSSSATSTRG